ncbi:PREDICTED: uncharacterized protein LOC104710218 [Camelina sativa]|uniref:ATP-dependent DNA helicase n=1 Tax=Camelina sativa TaxID=90675 RepID=A0ABM0TEB2_CAMSA|nr:PREDICTED: uncharacterized protein LOC104710218 [Camelina sativa]
MDKELGDPIILGRPFLATDGAVIDVKEGLVTLNIAKDVIMKFDINNPTNLPSRYQHFVLNDKGGHEISSEVETPRVKLSSQEESVEKLKGSVQELTDLVKDLQVQLNKRPFYESVDGFGMNWTCASRLASPLDRSTRGNPRELWNKNWRYLAEDVHHNRRKIFDFTDLDLTDVELEQYALIEIEDLLVENDKSLTNFHDMPLPDKAILKRISHNCLAEDLQFDVNKERDDHSRLFPSLNEEQKQVYNAALKSVENKSGKLFFLLGPGGTGKTFLYQTIIAKLRSIRKIVIHVASAGIAALLLHGERTAHSRFKIPININEGSTCEIKAGTMLAMLISKADLVIWDEASMAHRHAFEAVNRTIIELMALDDETALTKPFGGKTVLLRGDFRQILHVIPQGSR